MQENEASTANDAPKNEGTGEVGGWNINALLFIAALVMVAAWLALPGSDKMASIAESAERKSLAADQMREHCDRVASKARTSVEAETNDMMCEGVRR